MDKYPRLFRSTLTLLCALAVIVIPAVADNLQPGALPDNHKAHMIKLTASVYVHRGDKGDFSWMLKQPKWKNALFIYNDNTSQSLAFLTQITANTIDRKSAACRAGGGNGVIRPYQCKSPPLAAGVPTGPGFDSLTPEAKENIDRAIEYIANLLMTGRYTEVIYSASKDDPAMLGSGIFSVGNDVLAYIPAELKRIVKTANAH